MAQGKTSSEIAAMLGMAKSTVCYHRRRLHLPMDSKCARRYDWRAIQAYYDAGHTRAQCRERFGFALKSWQDAVKRGDIVLRPFPTPLSQLLKAGAKRGRWNLKQRLMSAGLKEDRCEECSISEWRGKPLSLALHHRNGDGRDNRIENLVLLCPNCHSQTPNFGVKNWRAAAAT